jgi:hypothetical protein
MLGWGSGSTSRHFHCDLAAAFFLLSSLAHRIPPIRSFPARLLLPFRRKSSTFKMDELAESHTFRSGSLAQLQALAAYGFFAAKYGVHCIG